MKFFLNTILILILSMVFISIYLNEEMTLTFYTLYSSNLISKNDNLIKVYLFSYDYDNLFTKDLFEYQLNYGIFKQKINKTYDKYLCEVENNNQLLYLYELSFRIDIKTEGLYKDCTIIANYDNRTIKLNIGDIGVYNYTDLTNIEYTDLKNNTIRLNLNEFSNINYILFDNKRYESNIDNIYMIKLDTHIINHTLIIHGELNSYIYEFDNSIYHNLLSDYFKYMTESMIYDKN